APPASIVDAFASELIASIDGPPDGNWESAWLAELERCVEAVRDKGEPAPECAHFAGIRFRASSFSSPMDEASTVLDPSTPQP
ncbi:MAG: hypothetical protein WBM96_16525, partial [Polyangiales bacterium]